jgi:hypothetical protein
MPSSMRHAPASRKRLGERVISAWRALSHRPATGRSFVIVVVVATLAALAVALGTLRSLAGAKRGHEGPAGFQL